MQLSVPHQQSLYKFCMNQSSHVKPQRSAQSCGVLRQPIYILGHLLGAAKVSAPAKCVARKIWQNTTPANNLLNEWLPVSRDQLGSTGSSVGAFPSLLPPLLDLPAAIIAHLGVSMEATHDLSFFPI